MSNPYFKNTFAPNNGTYELYRRAADELVERNGIDFKYITKEHVNQDFMFGEDNLTKFNGNRDLTFMIENYEDFDGVDDMFSKFGFQVDNRLILLIEQRRFQTTVGAEPQIDDLIFHPNSGKIFQVKHIKDDVGFFQMNGGKYTYRLTCEVFIPSHETFETNVDEVDILSTEDLINTSDESDQFDTEEAIDLDLNETDIFGNL